MLSHVLQADLESAAAGRLFRRARYLANSQKVSGHMALAIFGALVDSQKPSKETTLGGPPHPRKGKQPHSEPSITQNSPTNLLEASAKSPRNHKHTQNHKKRMKL